MAKSSLLTTIPGTGRILTMRSGKHPGRRPSRAWENGGSLVAVHIAGQEALVRRIVAISVFVSMVTALLVASPSLADSGGRGGGGLDAYSARRHAGASSASWRG